MAGAPDHDQDRRRRAIRKVVLGDGYGQQSALRVHFGLGDAERVDELVVRWPKTGEEQRFTDVAGDRIVEVLEGRGELVEKGYGEILAP